MQRVFAAVFLLFLLLSGLGCARHHPASVDELFIRYDVDRNGVITKEEFVSQWRDQVKGEAAWKQVDKAGKGSISRTEANEVPLDVWSDLEEDTMH